MLITTIVKPIRMKQRSGQRAFSESEAQTFLMQQANAVTSIVSGASITSMASTGSYTDNPGYLTLRSIHSRHRPVLDFIETGAGMKIKVIHPKYYKHLKKGAHQNHLGRQKMGWFLAD